MLQAVYDSDCCDEHKFMPMVVGRELIVDVTRRSQTAVVHIDIFVHQSMQKNM